MKSTGIGHIEWKPIELKREIRVHFAKQTLHMQFNANDANCQDYLVFIRGMKEDMRCPVPLLTDCQTHECFILDIELENK